MKKNSEESLIVPAQMCKALPHSEGGKLQGGQHTTKLLLKIALPFKRWLSLADNLD